VPRGHELIFSRDALQVTNAVPIRPSPTLIPHLTLAARLSADLRHARADATRRDATLSRCTPVQHNRLADVWTILRHFADSDAKYVLLGSYPSGSLGCTYRELPAHLMRPPGAAPGGVAGGAGAHTKTPNRDIKKAGDFFCIDLAQPPFSLKPMKVMAEGDTGRKHLYLFDRAELQAELNARRTPGARKR
jgi:hypothetical protein